MTEKKLAIIYKKTSDLVPYENNPRLNDEAVDYLANSIKAFGFKVPIVITADNVIVAGHTRLKACEKLKIKEVPCIIADDLTEEEIRAFRLADNKVGEIATWDFPKLDFEMSEISFDMTQFGFEDMEEMEQPEELDDDKVKENVIVSINCGNVDNYNEIKERLQSLCDEIEATLSVKMA